MNTPSLPVFIGVNRRHLRRPLFLLLLLLLSNCARPCQPQMTLPMTFHPHPDLATAEISFVCTFTF